MGSVNLEDARGLARRIAREELAPRAAAVSEIAKACASTALVYVSHSVAAKAIELAGSEDLKAAWLPEMTRGRALGAFAVHEPDSGSNAGAITTRAAKDGDRYILNGTKFFITSAGEADVYLVLVRTSPKRPWGCDGGSAPAVADPAQGGGAGRRPRDAFPAGDVTSSAAPIARCGGAAVLIR
jgi:acyl-CoA dehydrogenase